MNLLALRNDVGSILDYNPDVLEYKRQMTRFFNDELFDLFSEHSWQFAHRSQDITVYADTTATDGTISNTNLVGTATAFFTNRMAGQILEIQGSTNVDGEYVICSVNSSTSATLLGYTPGILSESDLTFVVKQRYIDLPTDCVSLLNVFLRDYTNNDNAHLLDCPKSYDETLTLDIETTGTPYMFVKHDDATLHAPAVAPTLTDGGAGVLGVPADGEYEVAYTYIYMNRESPLSPSATIDMTAGDKIVVSGLPNTSNNSGIRKQLYFKHPDTEAWYKADNSVLSEAATGDTLEINANYTVNSDRSPEHDGVFQRIRLYPRQNDAFPLVVRYTKRPPMMFEDTDTPDIPTEIHKYLVNRVAQESFMKNNNLSPAEVYRRKADKMYVMMKNRYLSSQSSIWVKAQMPTPRRHIRFSNAGKVTRV